MKRIYVITNKVNGKNYVGQTSYTLSHRFSQHKNSACLHTLIHEAILEYGADNFEIRELCQCTTQKEADEKEIYYIEQLNAHHSKGGYNLGEGGNINPMCDSEVKRRYLSYMSSDKQKTIDRANITKYNNSAKRKEDDKRTSERQKGIYSPHFKQYNDSKKVPVDMIDEQGNLLKHFDSCADACRYLHDTEGCKLDRSYSTLIQRYADRFNKNGKRAKFLHHCWHVCLKEKE